MALFNRQELIDRMKEFDALNGASHSADWYNAMSRFRLNRTELWRNFEAQNPTLAAQYLQISQNEVAKMNNDRQRELQQQNNTK